MKICTTIIAIDDMNLAAPKKSGRTRTSLTNVTLRHCSEPRSFDGADRDVGSS